MPVPIAAIRPKNFIVPGIVTDSLLANWNMQATVNTLNCLDAGSGSYNLTIVNAVAGVVWANGVGEIILDGVDEAARLYDSQQVGVAWRTIGNNDAYSIEAWCKTTASPNTNEAHWFGERTIIEAREEAGAGTQCPFWVGIEDTFFTVGRTHNYTVSPERKQGSTAINDGNWHHCVVVINNDAYTLYVDTSSDGSGNFTVATGNCSLSTQTSNLQLGARTFDAGGLGSFWSGSLGSVRVYTKALSVAEVAQNHSAELGRYS